MLDTHYTVEIPEGIELKLPVAGIVSRALAFIIDLLIRMGIYLVLGTLLGIMGAFGGGVFLIILFLLEWFYPVFFEVLNQGATPGKRMMNISVVHDDGTPISWSASLIRNLLRTADMFPALYLTGLITMLLNQNFKRLGDLAAGTLVIYRKGYSSPGFMPEKKPQQPSTDLTLEEQNAILHFAERSHQLSDARNEELANLLQPLLKGRSAQQRVDMLLGVANWLRGRR